MEKNDVHILDNRHRIFDRHADPRLHLPISEFPEILGLSWRRSGFVSGDCLIIISFDVRGRQRSSPLLISGKWTLDWRFTRPKTCL